MQQLLLKLVPGTPLDVARRRAVFLLTVLVVALLVAGAAVVTAGSGTSRARQASSIESQEPTPMTTTPAVGAGTPRRVSVRTAGAPRKTTTTSPATTTTTSGKSSSHIMAMEPRRIVTTGGPAQVTTPTTSGTVPPTVPTTPAAAAGPCGSLVGVYGGPGDPQSVTDFSTLIGCQPRYAMEFLDGTSWTSITQSGYPYPPWHGSGFTMIFGVPMLPNTYSPNSDASVPGGSCYGLTQGAAGNFDSYFTTVAQNMVSQGFGNAVVRLGWEFNGNWFPWAANGCSTAFAQYFDNIVTTMRAVPGSSFTFEWNPTRGDLGVGDLAAYYPGDAYVDWIGLDVYDNDWGTYPGEPTEFDHMETQAYGLDWLAGFAAQHGKPVTFPEWGLGWGTCSADGQAVTGSQSVCGGDNGTFVSDMMGWIATHDVIEATYWDYGTSSVDNGSNPAAAAALRASRG
ncbi:MAG TPA: glycosyl hydrolase [Acidimicrobiales bacterium]|nr:glycosyl hydrolase [Acidimicrobiales bacterium]